MDLLDLGKLLIAPIFGFVIVPICCYFYKLLEKKVDVNAEKLSQLELKYSTLHERVLNMKTDLKEIKQMLKQLLNKK